MKIDLKALKIEAENKVKKAKDLAELDGIYKEYLGRKGELSLILGSIKKLSKKEKARIGKESNELKAFLESKIKRKRHVLKEHIGILEKEEWIDITIPGKKPMVGHLHPLTKTKREIMAIFQAMGFEVVEGPESEIEWYNFDALNIPKDHPARDAWDTLWLKTKAEKLLLRTHTSPVQARYMEKNNPPLKIIVPGKVFRHEATNASHEMQFYQVEGLMVDKEITVTHFKAIISEFFKRFFKKDLDFRLKPDYFPFTEPSFDISITCLTCGGKGCPVCKNTGWLELAGAGMVHPNVFKACKLNPREWQGWAFGFGWDRLTMMKYKINDIRLFNSGDLRFLYQF